MNQQRQQRVKQVSTGAGAFTDLQGIAKKRLPGLQAYS